MVYYLALTQSSNPLELLKEAAIDLQLVFHMIVSQAHFVFQSCLHQALLILIDVNEHPLFLTILKLLI